MWWQKQPGKGLGPLGTTTLLRAPCWARSCSGLRETEHDTTSNSNTNKVPLDCGGAWGWEHPLFPAIAPGYSHNPAHFAPQVSKQQFHDEAVPSPRRLQCSRGACSVQADRNTLCEPRVNTLHRLLLWSLFKSFQPLPLKRYKVCKVQVQKYKGTFEKVQVPLWAQGLSTLAAMCWSPGMASQCCQGEPLPAGDDPWVPFSC